MLVACHAGAGVSATRLLAAAGATNWLLASACGARWPVVATGFSIVLFAGLPIIKI